jgi:hypothetical protein
MKANRSMLQEILKRFLHMGNIIQAPTERKDKIQEAGVVPARVE